MATTEIGLRLKNLRNALNIQQKEFAKRLGMSNVSLSYIENGYRNMSALTRTAILKEFNVNPVWLDTGEGDMFLSITDGDRLAQFIGDVLRSSDNDVRKRIMFAMSRIPHEKWAEIADIIEILVQEYK